MGLEASRLKGIPLFEKFSDDELRQIAPFAEEVSVSDGKVLVREGDYSYDLSIIDEGEAEVVHDGEVLATLRPGDVFGEMGVLGKTQRGATVRAKTPVRLVTLTGWDLRRLRGSIPALQERLTELAERRAARGAGARPARGGRHRASYGPAGRRALPSTGLR